MTVVDQLAFSKNALNEYVKNIEKLVESEVANEESFYADFRDLLKNFFKTEEFEVIPVPKAEERKDKPDFIVYMDNIPIIHVEGKNPYDPVDKWLLADTTNRLFDQVYRFRGREDNNVPVLVTDFIHIWVIDKEAPNSKDSDHQVKTKLKIIDDSGTSWKTYSGIKPKLESALNYVCKDIVLSISKVSSMIPHLVKYAKKLKEKIIEVFKEPSNPMKNYLENIRNDFLESIFSSDKEKKSQEFADLFSQTLIYGAFISWMKFCKEGNSPEDYSFGKATDYLPYGSFIYSIFADMSTKSSPDIRKNIFEKIEKTFRSTQFERISQNTETLMITFYSDFLKQYDPEIVKERGIVYTPLPIVSFIVRGIDYFLKNFFNKKQGIISADISFLDPAAGTMAFPCEILRYSNELFKLKFLRQHGRATSQFREWVKTKFLKNIYAFEILMAPYILGHLRTNMLINDLGGKIDFSKEKINLYLFNTLMELQTSLKDFRNPVIGAEIIEALNIRNNNKLLVILSNPPYNISSQNKFKWIEEKINYKFKDFSKDEKDIINNKTDQDQQKEIICVKRSKNDYVWDLQRKGKKKISNLMPLHNDYVKFIRFGQWKVKQHNYGIVAYITNNSYIDGIVFRGMRSSLMIDFDHIFIVDLHGDSRGGIPYNIQKRGIINDNNVFGIRDGVSIVFLIRTILHNDSICKIYYTDVWGKKEEKFEFLLKKIDELKFQEVPKRIDYQFCPDLFGSRKKYNNFIYLPEIFKHHVAGITTGQDNLVSDVDLSRLKDKLKTYLENTDLIKFGKHVLSSKSINIDKSELSIKKLEKYIIRWRYRAFDERYICYYPPLHVRDRLELMQYLISPNDNLALIINRQSIGCKGDSSVLISDKISNVKCLEGARGGISYSFPLKIDESNKKFSYDNPRKATQSNLKSSIKTRLNYSESIKDEQIFYYIYGILFSPTYRKRYYIGIKEDFPRIPITTELEVFNQMYKFGKKIADLHLLKIKNFNWNDFQMGESIDFRIYNINYDKNSQKIYFKKRTKTQIIAEREGKELKNITWIGGITQEVWDFEIGGRQQLKEWLYARRYSEKIKNNTIQRQLNNEELDYFLKMCDAIKKTIALLPELDEIYKKIDP